MRRDERIRAFLALEVPAEIKRRLADEAGAVRRELPTARWTRPEGQHLTLKFLGEVAPAVVDDLVRGLTPRLAGSGPVRVHLRGSGFFPSPKRPRVAWVGGAAEGADVVVAAVEDEAEVLGFARERRAWSLHLTQARFNRPWPQAAVARFLEWGNHLALGPFRCSEVVVFASERRPGGAVYTPLVRIPLG
ncbi:MAG: RNA 2',3'-cyclic phosphodiesterase [Thermoanaerobaculales bacterium]